MSKRTSNPHGPPQTSPSEGRRASLLAGLSLVLCTMGGCSNTTVDLFDPTLGLLAYWAFDEDHESGTVGDATGTRTVKDRSGFGHHGAPSQNPPTSSTDVPPVHFDNPRSFGFNGIDQWVEMGNPPLLNQGGPTTMAAWIRSKANTKTRNILGHGYIWNPDHDFALRIREGTYMFTSWDGSDHGVSVDIPASDLGHWVHLCGVYDGARYSLYRNGALMKSSAESVKPPASITAVWAIGARAPQTGNDNVLDYQFEGMIDEVRLYGRALGPTEVEALYRR